jgi:stage V sporulation protein B
MSDTKIAKGSIIILLGSLIFRVGGFIYRFAMASLLGPAGYGIFVLILPIIAVLQLSAEGGIPPAIAKYIAHYDAQGNNAMVKQIIKTSFKLVITLGIILSIIIYIMAEPLANFFHNPAAVFPIQCVSLITPFSVIVGELKGVFQGYYEMNFINITKAVEQSSTIIFAVLLVLANFYIAGAVIGTAIGYMITGLAAFIIFRKYIWVKLKERSVEDQENPGEKFTRRKELSLIKMLFLFSIPVYLTSLGELFMYDIGTWIIGAFMASEYVGYYGIGSPIARIPLMISMAVATAVLPATAAALSTENRHLLNTYINQAFRYVTILVLPMSLGIAVFAHPILSLLFPGYELGTGALQILAIGMLFFTLYTVSASVAQGVGKPVIPMISLAIAVAIELGLSLVLVPGYVINGVTLIPEYGINGAALATTIATFVLMVTVAWGTLRQAKTKLELKNLGKIVVASLLMAGILLFVPTIYAYTSFYAGIPLAQVLALIYLILVALVGAFLYVVILTLIGGVKKSDVNAFLKLSRRLGPLEPVFNKLGSILMKYAV